MISKSRIVASVIVAFVVLVGASSVLAHGGDPSLIHACVAKNGSIKIVEATGACKKDETALDWGIAGPAGPPGSSSSSSFTRMLPGPGRAVPHSFAGPVLGRQAIAMDAEGEVFLSGIRNATNNGYFSADRFRERFANGYSGGFRDESGENGDYSAIAMDGDGFPLMSYYDGTNEDLKVAHCLSIACLYFGATTTAADSVGSVGRYTSIAIGSDGKGLVSYSDSTNGSLKVLHCGNPDCNSGNVIAVADSGGGGFDTSLTIGADGLGLISYLGHDGAVKVLHCGNVLCNSGNVITRIDTASAKDYFTSISVGGDGLGLVSYYDAVNGDLKAAHCGNVSCSAGNSISTLDSFGDVGRFSSITVGTDGLGLISYYDATNQDLKVVHCGNPNCAAANIVTTLVTTGNSGIFTSITIGSGGLPIISYYGEKDLYDNGYLYQILSVFYCSNIVCGPYTRVGR